MSITTRNDRAGEKNVSYRNILFETADGIARLTLNRPERLNSFNTEMHAEVPAALASLKDQPARVLVITGAGRGFCAGQDLNRSEEHTSELQSQSNLVCRLLL